MTNSTTFESFQEYAREVERRRDEAGPVAAYTFPNGSTMQVGEVSEANRLRSTQYDQTWVYWPDDEDEEPSGAGSNAGSHMIGSD